MFYDALLTSGVLIVGKHESILGRIADKFEKKGTIYIKK
jgi:chemotaxis methyl-accepting protein methylase